MEPFHNNSGSSADADGARSIAELPLHRCIGPRESARLDTVSKSWAASASARLAGGPPFAPHLFLHLPPEHESDRSGLIVPVPLDGGGAPVPAAVRRADTLGLECVGATPSGRLAFRPFWPSSPGVVFLVDPVTGASQRIDMGRPVKQVLAVAAAAAGGPVDALFSVFDDHDAALTWRVPGGDDAWTYTAVATTPARGTNNVLSVAKRGDSFYALHDHGCVSVVDAAAAAPRATAARLPGVADDQLAAPLSSLSHARLVECDGEVLLVRRRATFEELAAPDCCAHNRLDLAVVGFEVYRLDAEGRRWIQVERLPGEDRALFVSPESTFAVRASEVPGCRSNCVYYVRKKRYCSLCNADDSNTCWGVYSMEEQKVLFEHTVTETGRCTTALWFVPNVV